MNKLLSVFSVFFIVLLLGGCWKPSPAVSAKNDVDYYTCTMHPWVHSKKPGTCPVCGMDLVPVYKRTSQGDQAGPNSKFREPAETHEFEVPIARQQQFGVTYALAKRQRLLRTIRTVGTVTADKARQWMFAPRTEGYVQKLYITSPGQMVEQGQDLMQVYSPDLAASEQELIKLLENRDHGASRDLEGLIQSAKRRLRQWNLTEQQIEELAKNRVPSEFLTLLAPFKGIVEDVQADQGAKFSPGQKLIGLTDLSAVWVWAEFYQNEIPIIRAGQTVSISFGSEKAVPGVIALVNPFISQTERTTKVRIDLSNPDLQLRPGMYVDAELSVDLGEGLTVPINAVIPTGSRNIVFLDQGDGKIEPRLVQLGSQAGDSYYISSGLKEGDRVVASANFLIDAESQVQGALQGFNQETEIPSPEDADHQHSLGSTSKEPFDSLLKDYSAIEQQLAEDRTDHLKDSINDFDGDIHVIAGSHFNLGNRQPKFMESLKKLDEATEQTFQTTDLDGTRVEFGNVSAALIELLSDFHPVLTEEWKMMICPMWKKSPARWLQTDRVVHNPFIGTAMSDCGQIIGSIETTNLKAVR
jgi:membrane fusion protein, copper/silver efflux system